MVLVAITGCYMGDATAGKTVILTIPMTKAGLTDTDAVLANQIQRALGVVDKVVTTRGLKKDTTQITPQDQARGIKAFYGVCGVAVERNVMTLGFVEPHRGSLSSSAQQMCDDVTSELKRLYGASNVRVSD